MNRDSLLRHITEHGPKDAYQRLTLMELVLSCNEQCQTTLSPVTVASRTRLNEKTVRRVYQTLCDSGWLLPLDSGGFRVRARAIKENNKTLDNDKNYLDAELPTATARAVRGMQRGPGNLPYRAHHGSASQPIGTGAKQTLGIENCPKCGGTGWQEVGPGNTVDICTCRGGPEYRAPSEPESPPRQLPDVQRAVNVDGLTAVREVLENEQPQARTSEQTLADSQGSNPGEG